MSLKRRDFIKSTLAAGTFAGVAASFPLQGNESDVYQDVDNALNQKVLKKEIFTSPVIIKSIELLRYDDNFICIVRSKDGAEGLAVSNNDQMASLYPIHVLRVQPFFTGKDARDLESLLDKVYVYKSNYKLQSLALWIPVATIEFAILDMLGKIAGKSMGELIGEPYNPKICVYQANNFRGRSAQESVTLIRKNVEETGARALKVKIGGRIASQRGYGLHRR